MMAGKPLVKVALWLLVLCCGINAAFGSAVLCIERERQALLKFKHALNATFEYYVVDGTLTSWVGENCCRWKGVGCNNETGHVIKLNLSGTFFTALGEIDPSLLELKHLSYLDLSGNYFGFSIPKFFGSFMKLRYLDLSSASFSGTVPWQIGNISGLRYLDLNSNFLQIENLQWLSHLSSLQYLDMGYANLSMVSDWVQPINMIPSLSVLRLSDCGLRNSSTPLHLNLTSLTVLDLSYNSLTLKPLDWLANFHSLVTLDLSYNRLEGPIPSSLWSHCNLLKLDLSSNNLTGDLNGFLKGLIRCGPNNIDKHGSLASIRELYLSNNNFSGTVPSSICNCRSISILDLSKNKLTGQVPLCFEDFQILIILDLSYNNLGGVLPNVFTSPYLVRLQLSHNNLSVLPFSIGAQSQLTVLDLSENRLSGSIPRWLGQNTSQLVILNLRSNMFHGNIPPQLSLLSSLQSLDLANNRLSGEIPTSFGNFTFMAMTRKQLSLVTTIDLSRNSLSGQIPQELTSLHGLQSLNLSGNVLEGRIPKNIGSLQQLESLDLSQNHLSGTIPFSISTLTFLRSLNLSNNNLSGIIPWGNQTFLSNYTGNYNLCGPPLPKPCSPKVVSQQSNTFLGEDEKDGTEHWWFYVGLTPGFVAGFWLTCGILIFSKSWRIAYFRFFDRLNERLDGFYVKMVVTVMKKIKG